MEKNIKITVANPAGNKTIFVHDKFERADYAKVAEQLLAMEEYAAEQVAFILDAPECGRAEGRMEMCGLEFCGNATRTFGLMVAKQLGIFGSGKVFVDVSGVDEILTVEVNTDTNYTKVKMPAYIDIKRFDISGIFDTQEALRVPVQRAACRKHRRRQVHRTTPRRMPPSKRLRQLISAGFST